MLGKILCAFNRHSPPRRRADWNGETFVSRCAHCHEPIKRVGKGKWRLDTQRQD